jgi:hypothetical protein
MTTQADLDRFNAINDDLHDYADWFELGDLARAKSYHTACVRAIDFRPSVSSRGSQGDELRFDIQTLEKKRMEVMKWIRGQEQSASGGGFYNRGTRRCSEVTY